MRHATNRCTTVRPRPLAVVLPALWALAVLVWELIVPSPVHVPQLLSAAPVIACAAGRRTEVLLAGVFALAALVPLDVASGPGSTGYRLGAYGTLAVTVTAGWLAAKRRSRLHGDLVRTREIASVAQQAVVQPVPSRMGPLTLATGYLSATRGAAVGGDLYGAVAVPWGVRLVIGDVRGHGLAAIGTVSAALGVFREAAHDEPSLSGVLRRLERGFGRVRSAGAEGAEEFLTVLLLEVRPDGSVSALSCGHPWPYLMARPDATEPDAVRPGTGPTTPVRPRPAPGAAGQPGARGRADAGTAGAAARGPVTDDGPSGGAGGGAGEAEPGRGGPESRADGAERGGEAGRGAADAGRRADGAEPRAGGAESRSSGAGCRAGCRAEARGRGAEAVPCGGELLFDGGAAGDVWPGGGGAWRAVPLSEAEPLPPLGLFPLPARLPAPVTARLAPREGLFLCTDGASDARNVRRDFFPLDEVVRVAARLREPREVVALVREALLRHSGGHLTDDVALLALRHEPCVPSRPAEREPEAHASR